MNIETSNKKDVIIDPKLEISVSDDHFEKMVDVLTKNAMRHKDEELKFMAIMAVSVNIIVVNFPEEKVKQLDKALENYPYQANHYEYPGGDKYLNIQKAVITNMTRHIVNSDCKLSHDKIKDRQIYHNYLDHLFTDIRIKK